MNLVIIGAGASGASCAARARRLNEKANIIMLEKSNEVSIANCGIPYFCSDVIKDEAAMHVASPETFRNMLNIDLRLNTDATAIDPLKKTITTEKGEILPYDKLVLALGAEPIVPIIKGLETTKYFTVRHLRDAIAIKEQVKQSGAKSVAIVGGGFIGVEMAENMAVAGLKTSIIEQIDQVLTPLDKDMVCHIETNLKTNKIDVYYKDSIEHIYKNEIHLQSGKTVEADFVIFALGIRPQTKIAVEAGLAVGLYESIITNEFMQTNFADIYACGDSVQVKDFVTNTPTLISMAGPANRQGRLIADHIFGSPYPYTGSIGSGAIKVFDMTAAFTGNNEKQLKLKKIPYEKMIVWGLSHAGYYPNATPFTLKVIYAPDGKILGAQAVGYEGVEKRIDVIATIIRLHGNVSDLRDAELCYAPPYSSAKDPINIAGMAIENMRQNLVKPYFGTEFGNAFIVDVRPPKAYEKAHIPNAVNIPVGQIRSRLNDFPRDCPIVLHCVKGYTSYVAARILMQNGFDNVFSYAGGLQQYEAESELPV